MTWCECNTKLNDKHMHRFFLFSFFLFISLHAFIKVFLVASLPEHEILNSLKFDRLNYIGRVGIFRAFSVYLNKEKKKEKTHDRLHYGCAIFMKIK